MLRKENAAVKSSSNSASELKDTKQATYPERGAQPTGILCHVQQSACQAVALCEGLETSPTIAVVWLNELRLFASLRMIR
jgi:hypothetical protein